MKPKRGTHEQTESAPGVRGTRMGAILSISQELRFRTSASQYLIYRFYGVFSIWINPSQTEGLQSSLTTTTSIIDRYRGADMALVTGAKFAITQ